MLRRVHNLRLGSLLSLTLLASLPTFCVCASHAETLAHWRFEDGKPGALTGVGVAVVSNVTGGDNALAVANTDTEPAYTADVPFSSVPQTGAKNVAAVELRGQNDFFTRDQKINGVNFGPNGSNAWTVEFSVRLRDCGGVNRLVGRDGDTGAERRGPLQILAVGADDGERFDIRVEMLDSKDTFTDLVSKPDYRVGRWYNVVATASPSTLSLYLDQLDGKGYQLVGTKAINGAANATMGGFSIGRGWNGGAADWMYGKIDEVRISDVALQPSQFLFSSPAGAGVVAPPASAETGLQKLKFPLFMGADPHVSFFNGQYWMYPTGRGAGPDNPSFFAFSSPDLKNWKEHGPVLQFKDVPWVMAKGGRGPWAPGVATKNGKYYFYYSVGPQTATVPSRIGVAVGDSPAGPFKDKGEPLLIGGNGFEAIDAMVFNDPKSGKSYFYAGGSAGAKLRVFELKPDMMSFAREIPVETPPQFTEGSFMHWRNGIYYLSYSHGYWRGSSYSVHYATSTTPYGPWQYRGAILVSDETRKGPGHHSFVQDPKSGQWFIVYHRWQNPNGGNPLRARGRSIAIEPIRYGANGEILPITMTDNHIPILTKSAP